MVTGAISGYCWRRVSRWLHRGVRRQESDLAAVIVGLFIAALAYLVYQRILNVDWHKVQTISQNGIDWVADALTHVSSTIGASHTATLPNIGIPLVSSVSAGFAVGLARG